MERTVLGYGGEEVSIVHVVYSRGTVSISSLGCFSSFGYSSKPSHPFPLSLVSRHIQEYFKKKKGGEAFIKPQQENYGHEEQINPMINSKQSRTRLKKGSSWSLHGRIFMAR